MTAEASKTGPPHPRSHSASNSTFGLKSMFYATTLIASGAAVWGDDSILFSIFVLIFWAARFFIGESRFKNDFLPTSLIISCVLAILYYLLVPSVFINREAPRRNRFSIGSHANHRFDKGWGREYNCVDRGPCRSSLFLSTQRHRHRGSGCQTE